MAAPGLYFAIYYQVSDQAFQRAAMTWALETLGGVCRAGQPLILEMVSTEADFYRAWSSIASRAGELKTAVARGAIFSHASKGGANDGLEFKPGGDQDGTLSQSEILGLPRLSWAPGASLTLMGCNTGLAGSRGWAPAGVFARSQGVTTVGQAGYAYFSTENSYYREIGPTNQRVYLWAYRRARNALLGSGGRIPGVTFSP